MLTQGEGVLGLTCSGTSGDLIDTYECAVDIVTPTGSTSVWCLFSEFPRNGSHAWAVKYENGYIPTNDEASIVLCDGTDVFHVDYGCWAPPSQIGIEGGYVKMDTTVGGTPFGGDCTLDVHYGRTVVDEAGGKLYICTAIGWETITTDDPP